MKELFTKRLLIRKFKIEDVERAHMLFSDDEAMRYLALYPALTTQEDTKQRINEWILDNEHYAIENLQTGEFVGYIAINPDSEEEREDTKELGFGIIKEDRRNGYMFETISIVLDELKKDKNIKFVWACCFDGNDASKCLIEKLGFELMNVGTFEVENDREYKSYEYRIILN